MARISRSQEQSNIIPLRQLPNRVDTVKIFTYMNFVLILGIYALILFKH